MFNNHIWRRLHPKNVFTSIYLLQKGFYRGLKNFCLAKFLLTDWLTNLLVPSDKCNSITAEAMGLIFLQCSTLLHNKTYLKTCIMALPKLTFVLLCASFLSPLLHRWQFLKYALWLQCKTRVLVFDKLLVKQSIVIHRDQAIHLPFYQ